MLSRALALRPIVAVVGSLPERYQTCRCGPPACCRAAGHRPAVAGAPTG